MQSHRKIIDAVDEAATDGGTTLLTNKEELIEKSFDTFLQDYFVKPDDHDPSNPRGDRMNLIDIPHHVINKAAYFIERALEIPTPTGWESNTQILNELERWLSRYISHLLLNIRTSTETAHTYVHILLNYWTKKRLHFDRQFLLNSKNSRISYHKRLPSSHPLSLLPSQLPKDIPGKPPIMWFDLDHIFKNLEFYGYDRAYMCAITSLAYCTALRASSAVTLTYSSIQRILIDRNNPDILYITFVLRFIKGIIIAFNVFIYFMSCVISFILFKL